MISQPVTNLVQVAGEVSQNRDYSLRAEKYAADDLGLLAEAFNDMLHQIQLRDTDLHQEIGERKRADASLQKAYAEREQRVRELVEERTAEIKAANEQLQREINERRQAEKARSQAEAELESQRTLSMRSDRLRSLGEMAAGIAHELNQPLSGVRGLAELTILDQEETVEFSSDELEARLQQIVDQADRMENIIQRVRMFAREAGKPEQSLVSVNDVVKSGIELVSGHYRAHGLLVEMDLTEGLPPVLANPYSLEEVILNLLNNARDALDERGPTGWSTNNRILVRTGINAANPTTVAIDVVDSGVGMPPDIAARVFDPFFTTKDPDKGTGLGLAICQSIVVESGGWLEIDSTAGEGTTVTISLPTATESVS